MKVTPLRKSRKSKLAPVDGDPIDGFRLDWDSREIVMDIAGEDCHLKFAAHPLGVVEHYPDGPTIPPRGSVHVGEL